MAHILKPDGEKVVTPFLYVVGADGGKGITCKLLGLKFFGDTLATRGIFADVHIESGFYRDVNSLDIVPYHRVPYSRWAHADMVDVGKPREVDVSRVVRACLPVQCDVQVLILF